MLLGSLLSCSAPILELCSDLLWPVLVHWPVVCVLPETASLARPNATNSQRWGPKHPESPKVCLRLLTSPLQLICPVFGPRGSTGVLNSHSGCLARGTRRVRFTAGWTCTAGSCFFSVFTCLLVTDKVSEALVAKKSRTSHRHGSAWLLPKGRQTGKEAKQQYRQHTAVL